MSDGHVPHRRAHPAAESRTAIPPTTRVSFSLVLRYPASKQRALDAEADRLLAGAPPAATRGEAAARTADPGDIERVRSFCEKSGLTIDSIAAESRTVHVSGVAATINALFDIVLMDARAGATHWREYDGEVRIPAALETIVEAVLGLSTKPVA